MCEEIFRVLKMVEEGKLSAEKATELLAAMNGNDKSLSKINNYEDKMLKVQASSGKGDKVTVNLPIDVVSDILKSTGKLPIKLNGIEDIDIKEISMTIANALEHRMIGEIVNVESASNDYVRVVIE